jgi:hypothetical protein
MAAVGLAPLVIQRQDLGHLLGEQPVRGVAARGPVGQLSDRAAGDPAVRPHLAQLEHPTGRPHRPARLDGVVEQGQQPRLGGRIDPQRDLAT